jgi:hypothetical protein
MYIHIACSVAVLLQASCEASDELYARQVQSWFYVMDLSLVPFIGNYSVTVYKPSLLSFSRTLSEWKEL